MDNVPIQNHEHVDYGCTIS